MFMSSIEHCSVYSARYHDAYGESLLGGGVGDIRDSLTRIRCHTDVYCLVIAVWKASLKIVLVGGPRQAENFPAQNHNPLGTVFAGEREPAQQIKNGQCMQQIKERWTGGHWPPSPQPVDERTTTTTSRASSEVTSPQVFLSLGDNVREEAMKTLDGLLSSMVGDTADSPSARSLASLIVDVAECTSDLSQGLASSSEKVLLRWS